MSVVGEMTMTTCGACGTTSELDELMIGCDNCERWFHTRCVGVTEETENAFKWFCPATECQQQYSEYSKKVEKEGKKKKSKKNKAIEDESDRSSIRSANNPGSVLEIRLKELEVEQQAKEREMEIEMIILEKRMEMEMGLKERRRRLENAIRAKQREEEKELLEKALADEKNHLEELRKMRHSFKVKMSGVQKEVRQLQMKGKRSRKKIVLQTPLRNPEVTRPNQLKEKKKKKLVESSCEEELEDSEEDSENEEEENISEPEEESEEESEEDWEDEKEERVKKSQNGKPNVRRGVANGLGQQSGVPTRMQMAARNGVTKMLPVFTGRPEDWPLFIGSYEASTEACGFTDIENLVRLQESLKGSALESVRGQLLFPKSVPKVISKLRQLYGRPEQLLRCHLEKVRKLEPPKADKLETFIPFGTVVEQLCEHLEAAGLKQHLVNPLLVQDLVDKLPAGDKRQWIRYKKKKKMVTLRTFTNFLSGIVTEACEANVSVDFRSDMENAVYNHSETESVMNEPVEIKYRKANSNVKFRMIPVTLSFRDRSVNTLAFLDEGASVTMVEKELADELGAEGIRQKLEVRWTGDVARVEKDSKRISLKISGLGGEHQMLMNEVCTVEELALPEQSLDAREMAKRYEHLRDVPITSYNKSRPRILIGLNNLHTMVPTDARLGGPGEPIAVESPLGWTIYGPNRGFESTYNVHVVGHHKEVSSGKLGLPVKVSSGKIWDSRTSANEVLPNSKLQKRIPRLLLSSPVSNRVRNGW